MRRKPVILVEGKTDEVVIRALLGSEATKFDIRSSGGREEALEGLKALASVGINVGLILDLNEKTEEELYSSVLDALASRFGREAVEALEEGVFKVRSDGTYSIVVVMSAGMPGNRKLSDLGVETASMDDFILDILLDVDGIHGSLSAEELASLLRDMEAVLKDYGILPRSSKELLLALRTPFKKSYSDHIFAEKVIRDALRINGAYTRSIFSNILSRLKKLEELSSS